MTQSPIVSVIVPTYNRAHLLGRAVSSVLAQTLADFELLIVDDGSSDGTRRLVSSWSDPRVRAHSQSNQGVAAARNLGLSHARGEWIAFLDDDNEWLPTYLESQVDCVRSAGADVVYCLGEARTAEGGASPRPYQMCEGEVFDELADGWHPMFTATMVRRALLVEVGGFDTGLEAAEDRDVLMRVALRSPFRVNRHVLAIRHEHVGDRLSGDLRRAATAAVALERRWRRAIRARRGLLGYGRWMRHSIVGVELADVLARVHTEGRSAALRPLATLTRQIPWSSTAIARLAIIIGLGPGGYVRLRRLFR